jgi:lysophospholipase L1-like esterase
MANTTSVVTVEPNGQSVSVTVTVPSGLAFTAYTTLDGATPYTFPVTVTTRTSFFFDSNHLFDVSLIGAAGENANGSGGIQPINLRAGGTAQVGYVGPVPASGFLTPGVANGTFTPLAGSALPTSRHLWMVGDSITDNGNPGSSGGSGRINGLTVFTDRSIIGQTLLNMTGGQLRYGGVAATGGYTAAQILATHVPTVVANAKRGDICIVLAGTNDQSVTAMATLQTTMRTIFSNLVAIGVRPVVCSIPPGGSPAGSVAYSQAYAAWLKEYALANGWPFVDLYGTLVDPNTNSYLAAYDSGDHVHPNAPGAAAAGKAIATVLSAHLPLTTPGIVATNSVPANLTQPTNAVNLTGGSASAPPSGFFFLTTQGTASAATVVDANYVGKKVTITRGSADDALVRANTFTLVAGHRMLIGAKFTGTPAASGTWHLRLESSNGTLIGFQGMTTPTPLTTMVWDFIVPAGLPSYSFTMDFYVTVGAATTLDFGQITVRDLTAEYGAA